MNGLQLPALILVSTVIIILFITMFPIQATWLNQAIYKKKIIIIFLLCVVSKEKCGINFLCSP